ncbi:RuvA C-terminal domain-containing protein [Chloroflexota bacterium]
MATVDGGKDLNSFALAPYLFSPVGSSAMLQLRRLMKGAYDRKTEVARKAKEREEKIVARVENERRVKAAWATVNPPDEGARRILSNHEYNLFIKSLDRAVTAVIEAQDRGDNRPEAWMEDSKALGYLTCVSAIKKAEDDQLRRREAARQTEAAATLNASLRTTAVHKFRAELSHSNKPVLPYLTVLSGYDPEEWCELSLPDDKQVREWAVEQIRKRVSNELAGLVRWNLDWDMKVLPQASYEIADGIPSIRWDFIAMVLVTANLQLGNCQVLEQHPGYAKLVQGKGQKLGTMYLRVNWSVDGTFSTPIALLRAFAEGHMEASGVAVIDRTSPVTTFSVDGADGVEVHDEFREFIRCMVKKNVPLWQSLLKMGLIDAQVAELLEQKWSQQLPQASTGSLLGEVNKDDVVDKLAELGWVRTDAANIVQALAVPPNATVDDVVKLAVEKYEASHQ